MKVCYVYADDAKQWNTSEWRCAIPARALNQSDRHSAVLIHTSDFIQQNQKGFRWCDWADVIVVERNLFTFTMPSILHWKGKGKVMIGDFDDGYQVMPPSNPAYKFWIESVNVRGEPIRPNTLKQFKWGMRACHALTMPSKKLAMDWAHIQKTYYMPNFIDLAKYDTAVRKNQHDGLVIGWGGSVSHLESFKDSGVIPALRDVLKSRKHVQFMLCGEDRRIIESLGLPTERVITKGWVPYNDWPNNLMEYDIGIAPLSGEYDYRRSWIKVLEYLVLGIPWVASMGPAYDDLGQYGVLVPNTKKDWKKALLDMVDNHEEHERRAGGEPYEFGIAQAAYKNTDYITGIYRQVAKENDIVISDVGNREAVWTT